MIVIIAPQDDVHALSVQSCAQRELGVSAELLDAADYPCAWNVSLSYGADYLYHLNASGMSITSDDVAGVWNRRMKYPDAHPAIQDENVRRFCRTEASSLVLGFLANTVNLINDVASERLASSKAHQLKAALEAGLDVPDTLVATDSLAIEEFYEKHGGNVVFKVLTSTAFQFSETRALRPQHMPLLRECSRLAPTIFQRRIVPSHHIRATVVDSDIFCASISTNRDFAVSDWRLDPDPTLSPVALHTSTQDRLRSLMNYLGLRYGAVDMIVDAEDGKEYFLEVNPGGQFLFIEIQTGQPISLALAKALAGTAC